MIFLGGTIGANNWRTEIVIPAFIERGISEDELFNPVFEHWGPKEHAIEDEAKRTANYLFYVLASPNPLGSTTNVSAYSLVEATMGLYDEPERIVVVVDTTGMPKHTEKAMKKAMRDLRMRFPDGPIFDNYEEAVEYVVLKMS